MVGERPSSSYTQRNTKVRFSYFSVDTHEGRFFPTAISALNLSKTYPEQTVESVSKIHGREPSPTFGHLVEDFTENGARCDAVGHLSEHAFDAAFREEPVKRSPLLQDDLQDEEGPYLLPRRIQCLLDLGTFETRKILIEELVDDAEVLLFGPQCDERELPPEVCTKSRARMRKSTGEKGFRQRGQDLAHQKIPLSEVCHLFGQISRGFSVIASNRVFEV